MIAAAVAVVVAIVVRAVISAVAAAVAVVSGIDLCFKQRGGVLKNVALYFFIR